MVLVHAFFCFVRMALERNTYKAPHVKNNSFIMAVSKFISFIEMKEFVIVNDLSYSYMKIMLSEKNPDAEGICERSVRRFCASNNIRSQSNLSKEEFQKIIFLQARKV